MANFTTQLRHMVSNRTLITSVAGVVFLCVVVFLFIVSPPSNAPGAIIRIEKNSSVSQTAAVLQETGIIRSTIAFRILMKFGRNHSVIAGDYAFPEPESLFRVVSRVKNGTYGVKPLKVTLPEGVTAAEMGRIIGSRLPKFTTAHFLELAKDKEGYLFPDTYLFMPNATPEEVIGVLTSNFTAKIATLEAPIKKLGKPLKDVVTMASILEEEARTKESKEIISGILWKRIAAGMPLQVDAPFLYVNGKLGRDLTSQDLKVDSPYNTYKYRGLPPTPISNPGFDSLEAAATPTTTPYWFYISDKRGEIHYAKTNDEHEKNIQKFLR